MGIKVAKFGGSSVADGIQLMKTKQIIEADPDRKYIVVSAPGKRFDGDNKITDLLYLCKTHMEHNLPYEQIFQVITDRFMAVQLNLDVNVDLQGHFDIIKENLKKGCSVDYIASRGEYLNAVLIAGFLGYDFVDAEGLILFDNKGRLMQEATDEALRKELAKHERAVLPGFYGSNAEDGKVRTFSRGGSDITGSLVARAVDADIYENWTDVSGFLIADPGVVKNPKAIDVITYRELRELSYMGASVLHEDAIFPVRKEGIPINIRNTNAPEDKGTLIVEATCRKPRFTITGIAGKKDFASITIEKAMMNAEVGFCMKVLDVFAQNDISIEHMPSGIDTMTILVHQDEFEEKEQKVLAGIHRAVEPDLVEMESDLALIAVVGRGMKSTRGTSGRIFSALAHANVNVRMIDQGSSELNIIIGVRNHDFDNAIKAIYDIFVTIQV